MQRPTTCRPSPSPRASHATATSGPSSKDHRRVHRPQRQHQGRKPWTRGIPATRQSHRKPPHLPDRSRTALRRPHAVLLDQYRQGESDLLHENGKWYLLATLDLPEDPQNPAPQGFIGVDLGIANIATTSTGNRHSGRRRKRTRENDRALRTRLQRKNTRSARRRAKRHAGREARRNRDINHKISKHIVAEAQRTGRGIALEKLSGIRERARLKKPQRVTMNTWPFAQLGDFIAYKARRAGVPVVYVNPAYTSQECSRCHHIDRRNRPTQATFTCRSCGFVEHADRNASHVIGQRAWCQWVRGAESQAPALTLIV
ncbi:RNA-guided endonuclease InsQ/TnpB family protein [Streptomyces sp. NPDC001002]